MLIKNEETTQKLNKHQRARLDDVRAKQGLTYLDSLHIASKAIGRTVTGYNEIQANELLACILSFREKHTFTWKDGKRCLI